jgi:hypothetical protein
MKRGKVLKILLKEFPGDNNRCNQVLDRHVDRWSNCSEARFWSHVFPILIRDALTFS